MLAACAAGAAAAASVASCGIDPYLTCGEACVEGGADVVLVDVVTDAGSIDDDGGGFDFPDAPVCDAMPPCFDAAVPDGWTPIDFTTTSTSVASLPTCPQGFTSTNLVYDAALGAGACKCTACSASGPWSCGESIGVLGAKCDFYDYDASAAVCISTGLASSVDIHTPTRSGNPSCGTSAPSGNGKVTASPARMCTPSTCDQSVCGQTAFSTCIYAPGNLVCPPGFSPQPTVGSGATASCNACPTCSIANADAGCSPSISLYSQAACAGSASQTITTLEQCTSTGTFKSALIDSGAPTPSCSYGGGNVSGNAVLTNAITVCCE
jgi:hypothetical protein